MPKKTDGLTTQELQYAHKIVELNSIAKAYKEVYGTPDMPISKVTRRAYKIANRPAVVDKIKEIRAALERRELWTKEKSIEILAGIAYGEDPLGNPLEGARVPDRVSAVKELNAMHGWNKQVIDHTSSDGSMSPTRELTETELRKEMEKRGLNPKLLDE